MGVSKNVLYDIPRLRHRLQFLNAFPVEIQSKGRLLVQLKYFFKGDFEGHFPKGHYSIHLKKVCKKLTAEIVSQIIFIKTRLLLKLYFYRKSKNCPLTKELRAVTFEYHL